MNHFFYPAYGWPYGFRYGQVSHVPGYFPYHFPYASSFPFYPSYSSGSCGGFQSHVMQWPAYGAAYAPPYTGMLSPMLPQEPPGYQPQTPMTGNQPAWESPESPESPWMRAYHNHVEKNKEKKEK
ncbi:MAG: hypothetical protein WB502_01085 [Thermoactinomyces sp.]